MSPPNEKSLRGQPLGIFSSSMIEDILRVWLQRNRLFPFQDISFIWTYDREEFPNGILICDVRDLREDEEDA